jgi:splicing factor 3A subunit 1
VSRPHTFSPAKFLLLLSVAFAEIEWHDYAIVQTIEFTAADANSELPPPMSKQEVENMTLAQKRMAAMIMENTVEDVQAHQARQAAAEAEAAAAVGGAGIADDDAAMEQSDDEDGATQERRRMEEEEREREIERAQAIQASSVNTAGPMKIRKDYVPKRASFRTSLFCLTNQPRFSGREQRQGDTYNMCYM